MPYDAPETLALIDAALAEDLGASGDVTCRCLVPPDAQLTAILTAKQAGVVCGLPLWPLVFARAGGQVVTDEIVQDGTSVAIGTVVMRAHGKAQTILQAERTALNLVQALSGTATMAARYAQEVAGTKAKVFDTRKTIPGLRRLQKHAVAMGGGANHRMGLFDQVLIKENHISLMGVTKGGSAPAEAVRRCREALGPQTIVEVEIEHLSDLDPCIRAGASIILCDNMSPEDLKEAVRIRAGRPVELEASGGITLATLRAYAQTGIERISVGALTHSVPALDLSLRCYQC